MLLNFFYDRYRLGYWLSQRCIWLGDWGGDQNQNFIDTARALSRNWKDRSKAARYLAATESKIQEWASYESDGSESSGDY